MSNHPGEDESGSRPSPSYDAPDARPQSYEPAPPAYDATAPYPAPEAGQPSYGQPYGQQGYGAAQQGGYLQPPWYGHQAPEHPQALPAMLTGIIALPVGLVTCGVGLLASPVAWVLGSKSLRRIRESGGAYGGEGMARAGQVTGIVGTVLLVLGLLALVLLIIGFATAGGTSSDYGNV